MYALKSTGSSVNSSVGENENPMSIRTCRSQKYIEELFLRYRGQVSSDDAWEHQGNQSLALRMIGGRSTASDSIFGLLEWASYKTPIA